MTGFAPGRPASLAARAKSSGEWARSRDVSRARIGPDAVPTGLGVVASREPGIFRA